MNNKLKERICSRCVMDNTDPDIHFNEAGVCNHCLQFDARFADSWRPDESGWERLTADVDKIKKRGEGRDYDSILGLSGGIDSSYLAVQVKKLGMRPLVVHVDVGWNSELAVHNIEKVVKYCGFELLTHVMNWSEVRDLQLAYLKAGVANQDVVQDHAIFASLYHLAAKRNIKTMISGENVATESVFPAAWHHSNLDSKNLHAIHRRFGGGKLRQYKTIGILQYYLIFPYLYGMNVLRPLNYIEYDKSKALDFLQNEVGYKAYAHKHGESIFTRFFQNYYLPTKFNIDKRKMHFSSMILSGQMSRQQALDKLQTPTYTNHELVDDKQYVARKLGISVTDLDTLIEAPGVHYSAYPNWDTQFGLLKKVQSFAEGVLKRRVSNRS